MKRNGKRALAIVMSLCMVMTPLQTVTSAEEMSETVVQNTDNAVTISEAAVDSGQVIPAEIAATQDENSGNPAETPVDPAADGNAGNESAGTPENSGADAGKPTENSQPDPAPANPDTEQTAAPEPDTSAPVVTESPSTPAPVEEETQTQAAETPAAETPADNTPTYEGAPENNAQPSIEESNVKEPTTENLPEETAVEGTTEVPTGDPSIDPNVTGMGNGPVDGTMGISNPDDTSMMALESGDESTTDDTESAEAPTVTLTASTTLTAGKEGGEITLVATSGSFADTLEKNLFTLNDSGSLTVNTAVVTSEDKTTATLTVNGTPTRGGDLTVTVNPEAFNPKTTGPVMATVEVKYPDITLSVSPNTMIAGKETTVDLTAENGVFDKENAEGNISFSGVALEEDSVSVADDGSKVTLTLKASGTGTLTVTAKKGAFTYQPNVDSVSTDITVNAPSGTVTAKLNGELTAGTDVGDATITLTADELIFADSINKGMFQLDGLDGVTVESASGSENTVTLTLGDISAAGGEQTYTVTIDKTAFKYQPEGAVLAKEKINVKYPEITLSVSPNTMIAGKETTVDLTAENGVFDKENAEGNISFSGVALEEDSVSVADDGSKVTLTLKASGTGTLTVTAKKGAFTYQPNVDSVSTDITVVAPTVTLTADTTLVAGTAGGTITLTAAAEDFLESPDSSLFTLSGADGIAKGLTVAVATKGKKATLTVSGTPVMAGTLTVTVDKKAFMYEAAENTTAEVTIGYPTITMTADPNKLTEGIETTVMLMAKGGVFNEISDNSGNLFSIEGGEATISSVSADDGATAATVTLTATSITKTLTIKAQPEAFKYQPKDPVTTDNIIVRRPIVELEANAALTAGTEGGTITLKENGDEFAESPKPELFTLSSEDGCAEGLIVTAVEVSGNTVTLTISGTPVKAGTLTVTVDMTAFEYPPANHATVEVTVGYPIITMSMNPEQITEGEESTVTLTTDGVFAATAVTDNFSVAGIEGVTVESVTVAEDGKTAELTLSAPTATGTLTITAQPAAFKYQPEAAVAADDSITVVSPSVTIAKASTTLVAGTAGGTITLVVEGEDFAAKPDTSLFTLSSKNGSAEGLTVSEVKVDGKTATLTISGTPVKAGTLTVAVSKNAFTYPAAADVSADVTVGYPTITMSASPAEITEGIKATVTLTAVGGVFAANPAAADFSIAGIKGVSVESVKVAEGGKTVELALSAPTATGTLTITAQPSAFKYQPEAAVTIGNSVTVVSPTVSLTASGVLTTGVAGGTITLTVEGESFAANPDVSLFRLSGDAGLIEGLSVSAVTVNGNTATLTISGTPAKAGVLTILVDKAAFAYSTAGNAAASITIEAGNKGSIDAKSESDAGVSLGSSVSELADAVLTKKEREALKNGADIQIVLIGNEISSDSVSAADKAAVESIAGSYSVGVYLDLELIKTINGARKQVKETNRPIRVVLAVPESLRGVAGRRFAIARVHGGSATVLKDIDDSPDTITIETDRFSTYAILYDDSGEEEEKETDQAVPGEALRTGDHTPFTLWITVLAASLMTLLTTAAWKRRRFFRR